MGQILYADIEAPFMMNRYVSTVIGTSLIAATLGVAANPADAFVITNTSATWDNALLRDGLVVGSDGVATSDNNQVVFREVDGESQVRWGDAKYGWTWDSNWELETVEYTETEWQQEYGWYKNSYGRWRKGWHWEKVEVTKTKEKWVDNGHWIAPTADYKSGLGFKGVNNLDLDVGEIFNIGTLTHFNQTIYSNINVANSAELSLSLDFGEGIGSQTFDFMMSVDETVNNTGNNNNGADCDYYTEAGKGCSDKITWDFALDQNNSFTYNNEEYSLELVGFAESLAQQNLVSHFISQEDGDNSASIFARLVKVDRTQDIPEPASILGLAGFGLFFARSRKKLVEDSAIS